MMPLGRIRGVCECWDCGGGPVVDKRHARQAEKSIIEKDIQTYYTEKEDKPMFDPKKPCGC